jgi:hypothetical protein
LRKYFLDKSHGVPDARRDQLYAATNWRSEVFMGGR